MGAVLGSAFDLVTVTELLEVPPEESARRSDRAVRARLLNEAGPTFEFANDLIREILYRTTPQPVLTRPARARGGAPAATTLRPSPPTPARRATCVPRWRPGCSPPTAPPGSPTAMPSDAPARHRRGPRRWRTDPARRGGCWRGAAFERRSATTRAPSTITQPGSSSPARLADRTLEMELLRELGGDVMIGMGRRALACVPYLEAALAIAEERERRRGGGLHPQPAGHHRRQPAAVRGRQRPRAPRARRWPARWARSARSHWRSTG